MNCNCSGVSWFWIINGFLSPAAFLSTLWFPYFHWTYYCDVVFYLCGITLHSITWTLYSISWIHFVYSLPYTNIFGGVGAFTRQHFELVNGFSNKFWGWGGEDDDLFKRYWNCYISQLFTTIIFNVLLISETLNVVPILQVTAHYLFQAWKSKLKKKRQAMGYWVETTVLLIALT